MKIIARRYNSTFQNVEFYLLNLENRLYPIYLLFALDNTDVMGRAKKMATELRFSKKYEILEKAELFFFVEFFNQNK